MREAMKKNNQLNMQQFRERLTNMTFDLPDWISSSALENYIRFCYTTEFKMVQTSSSQMRKERPKEALDLFRLACYLQHESLQECLVAREIIPKMNSFSALLFLMELFLPLQNSPCKREPSDRVKTFLCDYCMFYLAKNLPLILRQEKQKLIGMPQNMLYEILRESLYYIMLLFSIAFW